MTRKIQIFDTTLRDGEQCPGASMNTEEKLDIVRKLLELNVDVIEAGFPASSPGDFESVRRIAELVGDRAVVCGLTRAVEKDIDKCAEALKDCPRPRIHTGIGVSPEHLKYKFKGMTLDQAIERGCHAVRHARKYVDDVEFYAEDAGRAPFEDLAKMIEAVIEAGATVVNIPDTTGYNMPWIYGERIKYLMDNVKGIENVTVSVHCHNDLGCATALALEGVRNGATQVECTLNGLGERAGNTAMEEIVMAIKMHEEDVDGHTDINPAEFLSASRLVSSITGFPVQPNKAIVGANAFAHSSGIHQDGIIKDRTTYEIIDPSVVGFAGSNIVLTARSGHAALRHRLEKLGYTVNKDEKFDRIYNDFLDVADRKKEITDDDLHSLMGERKRIDHALYTLKTTQVSCGTPSIPTATVTVVDPFGNERTACAYGTGPVDALFKAIDSIVQAHCDLDEYNVMSVTRGIDALGEVMVRISGPDGEIYSGRGSELDITVSSAKAYLNALNRMLKKQMR